LLQASNTNGYRDNKSLKKLLFSCYILVIFCSEIKNEVILLKIDMLEVKKDRLAEINKQLKKAFRIKKNILIDTLKAEKKTLLQEIKNIESKRGETIERK
jgi:hypothetical protein